MQPDAETLLYLSLNLNKQISFFFPDELGESIRLEDLNPLEHELLLQIKRLTNEDLKRLIAQARALADLYKLSK